MIILMTINKTFAEVAGWYGMAAIIAAYSLVSFHLIAPGDWAYQLLNLTGALGMLAVALQKKVRQGVILNVFWLVIATFALIQLAA